jgi:cellulose synthase/poly-beta-1,6-N-acetylglucosamine synthase-like glycosyltransferase
MSGAGSFYRVSALNELLSVRKNVFEERIGNLVEDYETTLALKQLGWRITSNQQCIAYTGLMPKLGMLLDQRIRWLRGTIDEWRRYGWCRVTWLSIIGMLSALLGIGYAAIWTVISVHSVVAHHGHIDPRYLLLFAFWSCYQAYQVRHMGWRIVLFEAVLLPEVAFNVLRNYWLVRSIAASYFTRTHNHLGWN